MSFDVKEFVTKKEGPLPVWGWFLIGAGGYYLYKRYKAGQASTTATVGQSGQALSGTVPDLSSGSGTGGSGGVVSPPTAAPIAAVPVATAPVGGNSAPTPIGPASQGSIALPWIDTLIPAASSGGVPTTQAVDLANPNSHVNTDLIARLQAQGLSNQQIQQFTGATPGSHDSIAPPLPVGHP
jgi:hypothetical protein